jgi:hypothetical protein
MQSLDAVSGHGTVIDRALREGAVVLRREVLV